MLADPSRNPEGSDRKAHGAWKRSRSSLRRQALFRMVFVFSGRRRNHHAFLPFDPVAPWVFARGRTDLPFIGMPLATAEVGDPD